MRNGNPPGQKCVWHPMPAEVRQRLQVSRGFTHQRARSADYKGTSMADPYSVPQGRGAYNLNGQKFSSNGEGAPYSQNDHHTVYNRQHSQSESPQQRTHITPQKYDTSTTFSGDCSRCEHHNDPLTSSRYNRIHSDHGNYTQYSKDRMVYSNNTVGHVGRVDEPQSRAPEHYHDYRGAAGSRSAPRSSYSSDVIMKLPPFYRSNKGHSASWERHDNGDRTFHMQQGSLDGVSNTIKARHTIHFRGSRWKKILKRKRITLESSIREDVSSATGFRETDILYLNLEFNGVLVVSFVLQHLTEADSVRVHEIMSKHVFSRTTALYDDEKWFF